MPASASLYKEFVMTKYPPDAARWPCVLVGLICLVGLASVVPASSSSAPGDDIVNVASVVQAPGAPGNVKRVPAPDGVLPADALPQISLRLLRDEELRPGGNLIPIRVRFRNGDVDESMLRVHLMESPSLDSRTAPDRCAGAPEAGDYSLVRQDGSIALSPDRDELAAAAGKVFPSGDPMRAGDVPARIGLCLFEDVDPAAWRISVAGQNVTSQASRTTRGVFVNAPEGLQAGRHFAEVGNGERAWQWAFWVGEGMRIYDFQPYGDLGAAARRPVISAGYYSVGVEVAAIRLTLNSEDVSDGLVRNRDSVSFRPASDLPDGHYIAALTLIGSNGEEESLINQFTVGAYPAVRVLSPSPAASFAPGAMPDIELEITIVEGEIDPRTVRLFFDGEDVTEQARMESAGRRSMSVRYRPGGSLRSGVHAGYLKVASSGGLEGFVSFDIVIE